MKTKALVLCYFLKAFGCRDTSDTTQPEPYTLFVSIHNYGVISGFVFYSPKFFPDEERAKKLCNGLGKMLWFKTACTMETGSFPFMRARAIWTASEDDLPEQAAVIHLKHASNSMCSLLLSVEHVLWSITSLISNQKKKTLPSLNIWNCTGDRVQLLPFTWTVIHSCTESCISKSLTYETMCDGNTLFYFILHTVVRTLQTHRKIYLKGLEGKFAKYEVPSLLRFPEKSSSSVIMNR